MRPNNLVWPLTHRIKSLVYWLLNKELYQLFGGFISVSCDPLQQTYKGFVGFISLAWLAQNSNVVLLSGAICKS